MKLHTSIAAGLSALMFMGCVTGSHAAPPEGEYDDAPPPAPGEIEAEGERQGDEDERYDALDGYGQWVSSVDYGQVWRPTRVAARWRPYSRGRWAYRRAGWTWVSDYPWGWVTFHYGRWVYDNPYGWVWIPGNVWGPAWVTWAYTDSYIGWAPLPYAVGARWRILDPWWCFAPRRAFARRRFRPSIVPKYRNRKIVRRRRAVPKGYRRVRRPVWKSRRVGKVNNSKVVRTKKARTSPKRGVKRGVKVVRPKKTSNKVRRVNKTSRRVRSKAKKSSSKRHRK